MTDAQTQEQTAPTESQPDPPGTNHSLLRWAGSVLTGWAVFALIDEITPAKVYGKLGEWMTAYSTFVDDVTNVLFGWLEFGWFRVTSAEDHVLVLALIWTSVGCRLIHRQHQGGLREGRHRIGPYVRVLESETSSPLKIFVSAILYVYVAQIVCMFLVYFTVVFLTPQWFSCTIVGLFLLMSALGAVLQTESRVVVDVPKSKQFLREEIVRCAIALAALVFLNYTLFRYLWT